MNLAKLRGPKVGRASLYALGWGAVVTFLLLSALWHQSGVLDFVDANFPPSLDATIVSLRRYSASWDWYANMGRPNPSFLSEQFLLAPYLIALYLFGTGLASKVVIFAMVFSAYCGTVVAMRRLRLTWFATAVAATFSIVNPWFFDEIAQGHIYLLVSAWAVPLVYVLYIARERWTARDSILAFVAIWFIVSIDFRFAALVYFVAIVGLCARARGGISIAETAWRSAPLIAPPFLLAFIVFAYASMVGALRAGNAPSPSSLEYYSNFTSLWASITLVRPNYNSLDQIMHLGDHLVFYWAFAYGAILLVALRAFFRPIDRRLTAMLAIVAATGIVLGSGLQSPFGSFNAFLHDRVPLYGDLFRDPSKFFILQDYAFTFLLGMSCARFRFSKFARVRDFFDAPIAGVVRAVGIPIVATIAVTLYLAPFVGWDFSTATAFDEKQNAPIVDAVMRAQREANSRDARFSMFPPGVRTQYTGSDKFVYDPLALFPIAPDVRVPVGYDFDDSSLAARWALASVDGARTNVPASLLEDLGIARIVARKVPGQYDIDVETEMLRPLTLEELANRGGLRSEGDDILRIGGGIALGSDGITVVDGDRQTIVAARSLGIVPERSAWCFATQCRAGAARLSLSGLSVAPTGTDLDVSQFGTAAYGPHWIVGTIAWAELNLNASRSAAPSIVGFGKVEGTATFETSEREADVWIRTIRNDARASYRIDGFDRPLRYDGSPSLALDGFAWHRLGRVRMHAGKTTLTLSGVGPRLCISAIRLTAIDSVPTRNAAYVGALTDASSWSSGNTFVRTADWSFDGFRVLFGGRKSAYLEFQTSVPDGHWRIALNGRSDHRGAIATVSSATSCRLAFQLRDAIVTCDLSIRGGRFRIASSNGDILADGIAIYDKTIGHDDRLIGHALAFEHENSTFTIENPHRYRYVVARIADPALWKANARSLGLSSGYGMLFDGSSSTKINATFGADSRFALGVGIVFVTIGLIIVGIKMRGDASARRKG